MHKAGRKGWITLSGHTPRKDSGPRGLLECLVAVLSHASCPLLCPVTALFRERQRFHTFSQPAVEGRPPLTFLTLPSVLNLDPLPWPARSACICLTHPAISRSASFVFLSWNAFFHPHHFPRSFPTFKSLTTPAAVVSPFPEYRVCIHPWYLSLTAIFHMAGLSLHSLNRR